MCVVTRQMSVLATEEVCPVSGADICPVSTADICPVSAEDIWLLWGHLGKVENDFDPFFIPKMRKKMRQNGTNPAEPVEHMEPRKRRHGPLRGASFYTRRGLGLCEFSKQTPSN